MIPTIKDIKVEGKFRYLWLKQVNDFNLDVHCAKCLIGNYVRAINATKITAEVVLNESKYYYLCGVAYPFKWENNFHLAWKYHPKLDLKVSRNGIDITIENAVQIPIIKQKYYDHPKGHLKTYNTCRNWQFAYQMNDI